MLKNILTGNVIIGYVFNKISISNDREENIPRRIRITLISDVIHILTITLVNTQFRAYPFYKAPEWMPHKKLLLNSIDF